MAKDEVDRKLDALREWLRRVGSIVVGFSGGVDSTFLAVVAGQTLGERALAVTGDSPSLKRNDLAECRSLAEKFGFAHRVLAVRELENPAYVANAADRCFHCKSELFEQLTALARAEGFGAVADGSNLDDLGDFRPGREAARKLGVCSPLAKIGFTKADIREASRRLGLPTADRPAAACLASRVPYGTAVTAELLGQIERAEAALAELGFRQVRVRTHGEIARIELGRDEIDRLLNADLRDSVTARIRACGFRYVTVDLAGYRTGSLNEPLA